MTYATIITRQAEVQAYAFGMADMQVAIGLGRKTGANTRRILGRILLHRCRTGFSGPFFGLVTVIAQVVFDDGAQEIGGGNLWCRGGHILKFQ